MPLRCRDLLTQLIHVRALHQDLVAFTVPILLIAGVAVMLCSCTTAIPLQRIQPVVGPLNNPCKRDTSFTGNETSEFHYVLSNDAPPTTVFRFEDYYTQTRARALSNLPPVIKGHKVTNAIFDFMTAVSGEAQLNAQIAAGRISDANQIATEREAIKKHSAPVKLTHGEMKDFADKLFDHQLKLGAASLTGIPVDQSALSAQEAKLFSTHSSLGKTNPFAAYFEAYYKGKFFDRMGTQLDKPQISATVPDSEIVAAETVLLEFLIDSIDCTPVMGDAAPDAAGKNTTFYPGANSNQPTAFTTKLAGYVRIPTDHNACGITTTNAWVLRDLANGASAQATGVGGLVANTPGGISFGLGVFGKISIGDNQTLSVMVKTAASRLALRATLAASYWTLKDVKFDVSEP